VATGLAWSMYSRYELTDALVDPKRLLRLEGVDCVSYQTMGLDDLPRADAYYDPRPDINAVFYNEDAQFERLRFTLAHELGHKVLGHHDIYAVTLPRIEQEREANAFAAELLAPSPLIHLIGITSVDEICAAFDVSQLCAEAVLKRMYFFSPERWPHHVDMFRQLCPGFIEARKNLHDKRLRYSI